MNKIELWYLEPCAICNKLIEEEHSSHVTECLSDNILTTNLCHYKCYLSTNCEQPVNN